MCGCVCILVCMHVSLWVITWITVYECVACLLGGVSLPAVRLWIRGESFGAGLCFNLELMTETPALLAPLLFVLMCPSPALCWLLSPHPSAARLSASPYKPPIPTARCLPSTLPHKLSDLPLVFPLLSAAVFTLSRSTRGPQTTKEPLKGSAGP